MYVKNGTHIHIQQVSDNKVSKSVQLWYVIKWMKYIQLVEVLIYTSGGGPRGVMVKTMDCGIVVNEFEH